MSNGSYGAVRHLTCLRWAKVDMPENAHYNHDEETVSNVDIEEVRDACTSKAHFFSNSSIDEPPSGIGSCSGLS